MALSAHARLFPTNATSVVFKLVVAPVDAPADLYFDMDAFIDKKERRRNVLPFSAIMEQLTQPGYASRQEAIAALREKPRNWIYAPLHEARAKEALFKLDERNHIVSIELLDKRSIIEGGVGRMIDFHVSYDINADDSLSASTEHTSDGELPSDGEMFPIDESDHEEDDYRPKPFIR